MSVSWGTQYAKLKTNLRLAANRLRLLQKKKTEQAMKARTEIAEFLRTEKEDRARIRVESIIREDFVVEAYELLEMFCELLLARFGLIQQMKELDDGIAESVSSILWVAPRISHEVTEFKIINDQLQQKYGKQFAEAARMNQLPESSRVSPKLVQKLSVSAPSKILVEKYLIEIARCANIDFTPDARVMRDDDDEIAVAERNLINFINEDQIGWKASNYHHGSTSGHHFGGGLLPPSGSNYGFGHGGGNGGSGLVSVSQSDAASFGLSSTQLPFANVADCSPHHYAPSDDAPSLSASTYADASEHSIIQHQPCATSTHQSYFQNPKSSSDCHFQQQHLSHFVQQLPQPVVGSDDSTVGRKLSEHIYEVPPLLPDDFFSQFPDPPTGLPTAHSGGGGGLSQPPASNANTPLSTTAGDGLDFDDLAKRFRELKNRL